MSYIFRGGLHIAHDGGPDGSGPHAATGDIAVAGDRIVHVGPTEGTDFESFEPIDASRRLISPGLINAHAHAVLLALRGTVEDIEGNLVYQYMVPVSYLLSAEARSAVARLACVEAIRSGTTSMVDPLRMVADYAPAMIGTGLRLWLAESCADAVTTEVGRGRYRFDRDFGETFLRRTDDLIERFHGAEDDRVRVMMAAHGPDNCSPWMLREIRERAAKHGLRRTCHLSQIISEKQQVEALHGCSSTEYLDANDFLGEDLIAAHWTFCSPGDVERLAQTGTWLVHCPATMSAKGPHPLPMKAILEAGCNITLGTDNMSHDMFQTLKAALTLHRGAYGRSVTPGPGRVFDYATVEAARALDHPGIGRIAPGMKADLALFDLCAPAMAPRVSALANLVHYGHQGIVTDTMVDGRFVMRGRVVLSVDEAAAVEEAQRAVDGMWEAFAAEDRGVPLPRLDPDLTAAPG